MNLDIELVKSIVCSAGEKVMSFYNNAYESSLKDDKSVVTEADIASDDILVKGLTQFGFPILSEESIGDMSRCDAEFVWIVDPLDGTQDFIQKTGEFSLMVGLVKNGEPFFGIVYLPAEKKMYFAEKGKGAFVQIGNEEAKEIHVSMNQTPEESTMVVSRNHLSDDVVALAGNLKVSKWMKCGSNGVKIGRIAEGVADIFVNTSNKMGEWDACAPHIILTEAGGEMTDIQGNQIVYNQQTPKLNFGIVASNGNFHSFILSHIHT